MSNRMYPVKKEDLDNGNFSIIRSIDVPQNYPKFFYQEKPFGLEIEGWDEEKAIDDLNGFMLNYAVQLVSMKFDVPFREVMEGVKEAMDNNSPANMYSDQVFHLIRRAAYL